MARSERGRGRRRERGREGRGSIALLLVLLWAAALFAALGLRQRASRQGFGWIDPARLELARLGPGFDPRWSALFDATTAAFPLLRSDDAEGLAALRDAIGALSFVRSVGEPRVVWPDGLELELVLHVPVACVPVGERFRAVAEDGTLLAGLWPLPPEVQGAPLPVIGPLADGVALFPLTRAGDWLAEPEHLAALDVALSLREHVGASERAALGPLVIDATRFAEASVDEPGIRIELAGNRTVWFGRAPAEDAPGELPAERKWASLREALALSADGRPEHAWERLDVRWDQPELWLTNGPLVARAVPEMPRRRGEPDPEAAAPLLQAAPEAFGASPSPRGRVR